MCKELVKVLIRRNLDDGMSKKDAGIEAYETYHRMRDEVKQGNDPEEVLRDEELEPDYVFDLL